MPTGKVKWYDTDKGFGFLADDEGGDVFVHANALPEGTTALKPGTRVEFGVMDGRRGAQALSVTVLDQAPSVARKLHDKKRKPADEMVGIVEDTIRLLDGASMQLRKGRYPDAAGSARLAAALRAIADTFDGS
ncbi:cold-shock protein [Arsenicicoccus cauae]|uniref:cold-shock protein n=1 Tax=Arsenicicoccus cauae TaxID=2663847 RepID=UPI00259AA2BB|nr:cold shock domain-containing protein [uncultured Arsenicicoccus sp.]